MMDNRAVASILKLREASRRPTPESSIQLDAYFARYWAGANERQQVTQFFPYSMYKKRADEPMEPSK